MDNTSLSKKCTRVIMAGFVCGSLAATQARGENLSCVDVRPNGRLVDKHIVFEKDGVRSTDMFPLLRSFDSETGVIAAINNGRPINIKVSDWTALHVELVRPQSAAQRAPPRETPQGSLELTVESNAIRIDDGLIALAPNGCESSSANPNAENVFYGTINFDGSRWRVVGKWSTFTPPSGPLCNDPIRCKPGG